MKFCRSAIPTVADRPLCDIRSFEFRAPKLLFGAMTTQLDTAKGSTSTTPARLLV
jgi:hypothetical protein